MFRNSLYCPIKCESEGFQKGDTQSHIVACKALSEGVQPPLIDIYSEDISKQAKVAKVINRPGVARAVLQTPS